MNARSNFISLIAILHRVIWRWPIFIFVIGLVELVRNPQYSLLHILFFIVPAIGAMFVEVVREHENPNPADLGLSSLRQARYAYPLTVLASMLVWWLEMSLGPRPHEPIWLAAGAALLFVSIAYLLRPRPKST
jgi:hypothetical protein